MLLEQGDLAGKRYELTASICSNPVCECGIVSLRCAPVAGESQPRSSSAMVGYHEILPYAAPLEVSLNLRSWLFDDQYCVRPKCPCQAATITFHPLPTRNEARTKPPTELPETPSCISVCYHYDSGDVEILPDSRHEEATGRELIAALRQLQPDVGGFLAKRHGALRQLYRCSTKQRTVRLPTPKPMATTSSTPSSATSVTI